MITNIDKAKQALECGNCTLAFACNESVETINKRGVAPLLEMIDKGIKLKGYSVADKVVGKAAALLYLLLEPDEVYAKVISKYALSVFEKHNIKISYGILTDAIKNRTNTGFCPMETAVIITENPVEALDLIKNKIAEMR